MKKFYHKPVLFNEALKFLDIKNGKVFIDCTLGGGGHLKGILEEASPGTMVIGIDRDIDAIQHCQKSFSDEPANLHLFHKNYIDLDLVFDELSIPKVSGILLDLGVSYHQIASPERGFSFDKDGKLDMRMDKSQEKHAALVVNTYSVLDLTQIFKNFGELKEAKSLAKNIFMARNKKEIKTTRELKEIALKSFKSKKVASFLAKVFQAIRIEVNDELETLERFLNKALKFLEKGGRIVVISFHSLEDRIIKNFLNENAKSCTCPKDFPKCVCGSESKIKILTKKPITALAKEISNNPMARSAKLRAGLRI